MYEPAGVVHEATSHPAETVYLANVHGPIAMLDDNDNVTVQIDQRGNRWTRPENFVGNGPFVLTHWRINDVLVAKKSPTYWDAPQVRLQEIRFYPIESFEGQERAFRAGQLHVIYEAPLSKVDSYKQHHPELIHIDP